MHGSPGIVGRGRSRRGRSRHGRSRHGRSRHGLRRRGRSRHGLRRRGRSRHGLRRRGLRRHGRPAWPVRQDRVDASERVPDRAGHHVSRIGYPRPAAAGLGTGPGLGDPPGSPADRAPGALWRLVSRVRRLGRGGRPAVARVPLRTAERLLDLAAELVAHVPRARPDQPALDLAGQASRALLPGIRRRADAALPAHRPLAARRLRHLPSPLSPPVSCTRVRRPFSAVSMIVFSARRLRIPIIGIARPTTSSYVTLVPSPACSSR